MQTRYTLVATLLMALIWPWAAHASAELASNQGCYNCHGSALRGEAPGFDRLVSKMAKYKDKPAEAQKFVDRFLAGEMLEHIDAHERVSRQSALTLVHWLAQGGKN